MNKFKFYIITSILALALFSCKNDDDSETTYVIRDYGAQYEADYAIIESYMRTHYIEQIIDAPGTVADQDIKITAIPDGDATKVSLWDSPMTKFREVERNGFTYKVFYIEQRIGDSINHISPTRADDVLVSYDGSYLSETSGIATDTRFQYNPFPSAPINLTQTIIGWQEILPQFYCGTADETPAGQPQTYSGFGAGVMFIPSGLAYFNNATVTIPSYSPLIFKFKLYDVKRSDLDGDGIASIYEDINGDGIFTNDDTDGDGKYDYVDFDDDGDGYLTRNEVGYSGSGDPISPDVIPDCSGNTTDPARKRKYLDASCH